jgi:tetratricopeptide (TPR) repeat protein
MRWEQRQTLPYPYYREQLCHLFGKNARELGLLPDDETSQEEPASAPTSFQLDPLIPFALGRTESLLGRHPLLHQVKQRLFAGNILALTALNGLPGIGKTALAVALALDPQVQAHFSDGILWAGLGPQPNVLSLLAHWGTLLGLKPTEVENVKSSDAWKRALQAIIGSRRLLLIIDDAWSSEDALAFQIESQQCAHLLTTRLPHVAFAFAQEGAVTVPELDEADGLALLARFAPQIVQQESEKAQALVRTVGGLPLALTLMGKHLARLSFTGQPRRLHTALSQLLEVEQRLRLSLPIAPMEQPLHVFENVPLSLQASIAISDQYLSTQAHACLGSLALFPSKPNTFSEEAALTVSQQTANVLDELWDVGLLECSEPGRYTIHQTIADYAHTLGLDATAQEHLIACMLPTVQVQEQEYAALEVEINNIFAALDAAIALNMPHRLIEGVIALVPFLRVCGLYSQADRYLQHALQAANEQKDQDSEMLLLRHLAAFAELYGDYPLSETYARQGLALAQTLKDQEVESALLTILGEVAANRGEYAQAQHSHEEGLVLARQMKNSEAICTILNALGQIMGHQGRVSQSEAFCLEGLALARQDNLQEMECRLLTTLGATVAKRSNFAQSEQYCLEALALAHLLGHRELQSDLLCRLGANAGDQGKWEQAEKYFQEALVLARQIGHRVQICMALSNLGAQTAQQGNYAQAERFLQESIELARQIGSRHLPLFLLNFGDVVDQLGDYEHANACLQESVDLARHQGALWNLEAAFITWGNIHLKHQQIEAATSAFHEAIALTTGPEQDPQLNAMAHYGFAQALALRGEITEARRLGLECLTTFETLKHYQADEVRHWLDALPVEI